ncbi:ATP-binding cassette domain-containing protein [candidate division WWE3 bacterium]|uniref:ATP-binding cassette domain-containing protein n=1 Tax=candidate division WWE3 bacterium TaxID=2053526 RepID=A0A955LK95_UNCKA|nr:ATP-binding cassette domain-containing protein [candidate division WWE3 bacterium]
MDEMITIINFSKRFGSVQAVDDLSFAVPAGSIFAFLGANGSGKTTTIRTLLGIYEPDNGELLINGQKYQNEMAGILGYLPEERGLYLNSRVLETIVYFAQLKGLGFEPATKAAKDYLERVGLSGYAESEIKTLSSGQQQKIQLGIALINNPQLLILDEPTKGLDPVNRDLLISMLLELNKNGTTVVFTSHQMEEVEKIADHLVMIKDGRRKLEGGLEDVKNQFGTNVIHVRFDGDIPVNDAMYSLQVERSLAEVTPKEGIKPNEVLRYMLDNGASIREFDVGAPSLHEIFVRVQEEDD